MPLSSNFYTFSRIFIKASVLQIGEKIICNLTSKIIATCVTQTKMQNHVDSNGISDPYMYLDKLIHAASTKQILTHGVWKVGKFHYAFIL